MEISKLDLTDRELLIFNQRLAERRREPFVAYLLWVFTGAVGGHRYYLHRSQSGIAMTLVFFLGMWIYGIGILINVIWGLVDVFQISRWVREGQKLVEEGILEEIYGARIRAERQDSENNDSIIVGETDTSQDGSVEDKGPELTKSELVFCNRCGKKQHQGAVFCHACGHKLELASSQRERGEFRSARAKVTPKIESFCYGAAIMAVLISINVYVDGINSHRAWSHIWVVVFGLAIGFLFAIFQGHKFVKKAFYVVTPVAVMVTLVAAGSYDGWVWLDGSGIKWVLEFGLGLGLVALVFTKPREFVMVLIGAGTIGFAEKAYYGGVRTIACKNGNEDWFFSASGRAFVSGLGNLVIIVILACMITGLILTIRQREEEKALKVANQVENRSLLMVIAYGLVIGIQAGVGPGYFSKAKLESIFGEMSDFWYYREEIWVGAVAAILTVALLLKLTERNREQIAIKYATMAGAVMLAIIGTYLASNSDDNPYLAMFLIGYGCSTPVLLVLPDLRNLLVRKAKLNLTYLGLFLGAGLVGFGIVSAGISSEVGLLILEVVLMIGVAVIAATAISSYDPLGLTKIIRD